MISRERAGVVEPNRAREGLGEADKNKWSERRLARVLDSGNVLRTGQVLPRLRGGVSGLRHTQWHFTLSIRHFPLFIGNA